jgi:hypothetical protein
MRSFLIFVVSTSHFSRTLLPRDNRERRYKTLLRPKTLAQ